MWLAAQVEDLRAHGSTVETVFPDSDSEHLFGANAMDVSLRPAAHDQGRAAGGPLIAFWNSGGMVS